MVEDYTADSGGEQRLLANAELALESEATDPGSCDWHSLVVPLVTAREGWSCGRSAPKDLPR